MCILEIPKMAGIYIFTVTMGTGQQMGRRQHQQQERIKFGLHIVAVLLKIVGSKQAKNAVEQEDLKGIVSGLTNIKKETVKQKCELFQ